MLVTYLDAVADAPGRMPSPFATEPHPLARRAAEQLRAELAAGLAAHLGLAEDGKMFGVLVVRDANGRIGFLRGFSGMVRGRWHLEGFVPPAFDEDARESFWPAGECELATIAGQIRELDQEIEPVQKQLAELIAAHEVELDALRARHRTNRDARHASRRALDTLAASCASDTLAAPCAAAVNPDTSSAATSTSTSTSRTSTSTCTCHVHVHVHDQRAQLDQESRRDAAERRVLDERHAAARAGIEVRLRPFVTERDRLDAERAATSNGFLVRLFDGYRLTNARGETRTVIEIFHPAAPPGGAGDCAAPKLLAYAYRNQLQPLALAEFWVGAPPATGGRRDGQFYPACRGKCGPILAHMLSGLDADAAPVFGDAPIDPSEPRTLFEDSWLAVVAKPSGLLSVPGKGDLADCVQSRLRARYPGATGPLVVHRLDLDTSGLLLVAKDRGTYAALQRQFALREIDKRYIAWLDGEVAATHGTVDLPLRVDLDDRPRQLVDPVHGKPAVTDWQVLARSGGRTRVALSPRTGRAHQLRVHAAHPQGIGVPVVGDRLYGRPAARLMLHAEAIRFVHPHTQEHLSFRLDAPF